MSELSPVTGWVEERSLNKLLRAIQREQTYGLLRQTGVATEELVASAKLDSVANVTAQAMRDIARIGQAELLLAQTAPAASGRFAWLAEQHAVLASELVAELHSRLRRK